LASSNGVGRPAWTKKPWEQLPVAARPSVLAGCGDVVARRKFVDDFDVGHQSCARIYAFEQIVTEKRIVGDASSERRLEHVDIVNSLAAIGAFAEQILIDVGDRASVWVDAARV